MRRVFHSKALFSRLQRAYASGHARNGPGIDRNRGDYTPAFGWAPGAKRERNQQAIAQGHGPKVGAA